MKRFTFGALTQNEDPWGIRKRVGPLTVVEADRYRIEEGFVTFSRGEEDVLSVPISRVSIVSELNDNNEPMFDMLGT